MVTNLKQPGLSLFELGQSLGLAPPSHGYTIAEKSPEIVTAPGVYFPIKRGRVIPLKARQGGGGTQPSFDEWLTEKSKETTPERQAELVNQAIISPPEDTGTDLGGTFSSTNTLTPKGIEAAANTRSLQSTPINVSLPSTPQNLSVMPTTAPPTLSGMAEYEASAARMRGIPSTGLQTRGQPTASGFNLNNMTPLNLFAPPKFREKRSSPIFRSEQKTAFEKKWKPYSDLMANITGGIPLMPRKGGGITDPAMTEEKLRRLKEAFPDTISSRTPVGSTVPLESSRTPVTTPEALPELLASHSPTIAAKTQPGLDTFLLGEKPVPTPETIPETPTSTLETKYTLPGTEGTAIVGPERRFMGIQEILPGQRQYPASEDRTVSGDELARKNILSEIGAQRKEWEKEFAPRERTYYEAHPEELAEERRMEMVERANKPMVDAYMKLIEEAKSRAGGFGLMGLGRRGAREARAAAAASIPHLAQGLERLRATPKEETRITPHLVKTAGGKYVYSIPPRGATPPGIIPAGIEAGVPIPGFRSEKTFDPITNQTYQQDFEWREGVWQPLGEKRLISGLAPEKRTFKEKMIEETWDKLSDDEQKRILGARIDPKELTEKNILDLYGNFMTDPTVRKAIQPIAEQIIKKAIEKPTDATKKIIKDLPKGAKFFGYGEDGKKIYEVPVPGGKPKYIKEQ